MECKGVVVSPYGGQQPIQRGGIKKKNTKRVPNGEKNKGKGGEPYLAKTQGRRYPQECQTGLPEKQVLQILVIVFGNSRGNRKERG